MDPTQTPTQQPIQIPTPIITPQPKPNWILIVLSILSTILLVTIVFLSLQNQKLQKQVLNPPVSPTIQVPSPISKPSPLISLPPDETINWKTYTNNKYSFEFSYPKSDVVTESPYHSNASVLDLKIKSDSFSGSLQVTPMSIKDLLSSTFGALGNETKTQTTVSGMTATKVTGYQGIGGSIFISAVYFTKNNLTYLFIFDHDSDNTNQILSTFKFL